MMRTYRAALGGLVFYDLPERRRPGKVVLALVAGGALIVATGGVASHFIQPAPEPAASQQVAQTDAPLSYLPQ